MKARMTDEPASDSRRVERAVVVEDQMDVQVARNAPIDRLEEAPELLAAMSPMTLANHFTGGDVEGRKQRRGAMAAR
jgi:hypothetical protein